MERITIIPPQQYPEEYLKPMPPEFSKLIDENFWYLAGVEEDETIEENNMKENENLYTFSVYAPVDCPLDTMFDVIDVEEDIDGDDMCTYYVILTADEIDPFETWCMDNYYEYDRC